MKQKICKSKVCGALLPKDSRWDVFFQSKYAGVAVFAILLRNITLSEKPLSTYIYLIHQNVSYIIMQTLTGFLGGFHLWYILVCLPAVWVLAVSIGKASDLLFSLLKSRRLKTAA